MKLRFALPVSIGVAILLAGCGGTSAPDASTSSGASPASSSSLTGGFGDTAKNPDHPAFICAFLVNQSYFTVAGPDTAKAKAYCATNEGAGFVPIPGPALSAGSYLTLTPSTGCWFDLGADTVRVYGAIGIDHSRGWLTCTTMGIH